MRTLIASILICLFSFSCLHGQRPFEDEMEKICGQLANQLRARKIKEVAVANFSYKGKLHTRVSRFMADELNNGLIMYNSPWRF